MKELTGNLVEMFECAADERGGHAAVYCGDLVITYAEQNRRVTDAASGFVGKLGVKKGDRVAILLKNCPEYLVALYGALKAGATVVPVNNFLKASEATFILSDCEVSVLV